MSDKEIKSNVKGINTSNNGIFMAIDLELNQPSNLIISIGYAVGNIYTGDIIESDDLYVIIPETLNPDIVKLTGITDELLTEKGEPLLVQYNKLAEAHKRHGCFINPITWGGGDSSEILTQLKDQPEEFKWVFGRRWIDTKTVYVSYKVAKQLDFKGGLAKSMIKMGLKFEGTKHTSKDDAINTFRMYSHMIKKFKD